MGLTGSSACVKYLLFIFNLIFLVSGIAIVTVGAIVQSHYNKYHDLLDERFFSVPALLIATGVIIFTISFFGCCGAVKENHCMIVTFSALLILIFILELAAGIAGYVLKDITKGVISEKMNGTMILYKTESSVATLWNDMQNEFECCGTNGPQDWQNIFNSTDLPMSCCKFNVTMMGTATCNTLSLDIKSQGCLDAIGGFVIKNAVALGGVGVGIAFVQFLGIVLACCLAHSIRKHYETV